MTLHKFWKLPIALAALAGVATCASAADFRGQRIEIIVPYEAGGGTDIYARFLAPLLSEKLPGKPTVLVVNVPGAGAIAGGNQFERAKPDGLTVIAVGTSLTANYVFRDKRVKYKLADWIPIISSPNGTVVYANSSLGVKSSADIASLKGKSLVMGANNATGGDLRVLLSLDGLGLKANEVFGLNRGDARPSFERGEFNLNFDSIAAYQAQVRPLIESGVAVPLFSFGIADDKGTIVRDPLAPDVPTYNEVFKTANGKEPDGPAYKAWLAMFNLNIMAAKGLALPAGTPKDIVDTYNEAIKQVIAAFSDPKTKAQADDVVGPYPQAVGEAAGRALRGAATFDDETFNWLKTWLNERYKVSLD
jgi:tripartite-type tricarboxylate transporter receptor subunit TctC